MGSVTCSGVGRAQAERGKVSAEEHKRARKRHSGTRMHP